MFDKSDMVGEWLIEKGTKRGKEGTYVAKWWVIIPFFLLGIMGKLQWKLTRSVCAVRGCNEIHEYSWNMPDDVVIVYCNRCGAERINYQKQTPHELLYANNLIHNLILVWFKN